MYRFQEILQVAEHAADENRSPEEKLADLVAAAEASLPAHVIYPEPGSVTEVDARTGYALEEIWRETTEIYGGEYAPEITDPEKNPLCRGVYVYNPPSPNSRYQLLDNVYGMALVAYPNSRSIALAAARMVAADPDLALENVVAKLEDTTAKEVEVRLASTFGEMMERTRSEILEAAGSQYLDIDSISAAAERLAVLDKLSEMMRDGAMPVDGEHILEHAGEEIETIMSPKYLTALVTGLTDLAARTRTIDETALREMASDAEFWKETASNDAPPQDLDALARDCCAAASALKPKLHGESDDHDEHAGR